MYFKTQKAGQVRRMSSDLQVKNTTEWIPPSVSRRHGRHRWSWRHQMLLRDFDLERRYIHVISRWVKERKGRFTLQWDSDGCKKKRVECRIGFQHFTKFQICNAVPNCVKWMKEIVFIEHYKYNNKQNNNLSITENLMYYSRPYWCVPIS